MAPDEVAPRSDLSDLRGLAWDSAEPVSERQVRIRFTGGERACYGYDATVKETSTTIAISLLQGSLPGVSGACTDIGIPSSMVLDLDAPVGDREIVHG